MNQSERSWDKQSGRSVEHLVFNIPNRVRRSFNLAQSGPFLYRRFTLDLTPLKIRSYFYLKNYLGLTQWTPFGSCSVTCGVGEKSRTRSCYSGDCTDFLANNNNKYVQTETVSCDEGDCK